TSLSLLLYVRDRINATNLWGDKPVTHGEVAGNMFVVLNSADQAALQNPKEFGADEIRRRVALLRRKVSGQADVTANLFKCENLVDGLKDLLPPKIGSTSSFAKKSVRVLQHIRSSSVKDSHTAKYLVRQAGDLDKLEDIIESAKKTIETV